MTTPFHVEESLRVSRRLLILMAAMSLLVSNIEPLFAQDGCADAWRQSEPGRRSEAAIAYDTHREVLVMFGGEAETGRDAYTWEWNGTRWELKDSGGISSPPASADHRMAYDAKRKQTILFGGYGGAGNETWAWNGSTWTKLSPVTSPPARNGQGMVYDSVREVIVMFGGYVQGEGEGSDTWEWNGTNWTRIFTANIPSGRRPAMSFDSARGKVVLHGGYIGTAPNYNENDTWEYDGTDWTLIAPALTPPGGSRIAMSFDAGRGKSVLFVWRYDYTPPNYRPETWEWDGSNWSQQAPLVTPGGRDWPTLAYDTKRGEILLYSGYDHSGEGKTSDIWYWTDSGGSRTWEKVSEVPKARMYAQMVYDSQRGVAVLFGGGYYGGYYYNTFIYNDTWENNGSGWVKRNPSHSPPAVGSHTMAYDSNRGVTVLFGGSDLSGLRNETWEWDGNDWTQRTPDTSPPIRADGAMAYDPERGVTVLFGGSTNDGYSRRDVWEWDGTTWTDKTPDGSSPGPVERIYGAMAYDPNLKAVILYGGMVWPQDLSVWAWDGTSWTEHPSNGTDPGVRQRLTMAYDHGLGEILLFGGDDGNKPHTSSPSWAWNGSTWRNLGLGGISARTSHTMIHHQAAQKTIVFGGSVYTGASYATASDSWELFTADSDGDGTMDCADGCPADPGKIAAGVCGCGIADTDADGDGAYACNSDQCDTDPGKLAPGLCGCGTPDVDGDGDAVMDCRDECPANPAKTAAGICGCTAADVDGDGDGTMDCVDLCASDPNKTQTGVCGCGVADSDADSDGVADCRDECPQDGSKSSEGQCGCGVSDSDGDGDGTPDCNDQCSQDPGKTSPGGCGCGIPDVLYEGRLDCLQLGIRGIRPSAAPQLKRTKKGLQVTMTERLEAVYVVRVITQVSKKKSNTKLIKSNGRTVTIRGLRKGTLVIVSYYYLDKKQPTAASAESPSKKIRM